MKCEKEKYFDEVTNNCHDCKDCCEPRPQNSYCKKSCDLDSICSPLATVQPDDLNNERKPPIIASSMSVVALVVVGLVVVGLVVVVLFCYRRKIMAWWKEKRHRRSSGGDQPCHPSSGIASPTDDEWTSETMQMNGTSHVQSQGCHDVVMVPENRLDLTSLPPEADKKLPGRSSTRVERQIPEYTSIQHPAQRSFPIQPLTKSLPSQYINVDGHDYQLCNNSLPKSNALNLSCQEASKQNLHYPQACQEDVDNLSQRRSLLETEVKVA